MDRCVVEDMTADASNRETVFYLQKSVMDAVYDVWHSSANRTRKGVGRY